MGEFEIDQLMQAAVDAMVEAGYSDDKIEEVMREAIERARDDF